MHPTYALSGWVVRLFHFNFELERDLSRRNRDTGRMLLFETSLCASIGETYNKKKL